MRIAVVEDEEAAAEQLRKCLEKYLNKHLLKSGGTLSDYSIRYFSGIMDFLEPYRGYDLIFMDIEMPGINGMEGAVQLRQTDTNARLVFVTNMAQYALNGYLVNASDFILKPVTEERLAFCMDRLLPLLLQNEENSLVIRQGGGMQRLLIREITLVEVSGHTLKYHIQNGNGHSSRNAAGEDSEKKGSVLEIRGRLSDVEDILHQAGFLRCHNSYLINPRYIDRIDGFDLYIGGEVIPISHPRKKQFMDELNQYFTKGGI